MSNLLRSGVLFMGLFFCAEPFVSAESDWTKESLMEELFESWMEERLKLFTQICSEKVSPIPEPCFDDETKLYIQLAKDWDLCTPIILLANSTELSESNNAELLRFLSTTQTFANDFADLYDLPLTMCDVENFDPGRMYELRFCVRRHILCSRLNN